MCSANAAPPQALPDGPCSAFLRRQQHVRRRPVERAQLAPLAHEQPQATPPARTPAWCTQTGWRSLDGSDLIECRSAIRAKNRLRVSIEVGMKATLSLGACVLCLTIAGCSKKQS